MNLAVSVGNLLPQGPEYSLVDESTVLLAYALGNTEYRRRDDPPRHFVSFTLHFALTGEVPSHAVERAIQLSRDKYCSVWHSLRQDIDLQTTFEVAPGA